MDELAITLIGKKIVGFEIEESDSTNDNCSSFIIKLENKQLIRLVPQLRIDEDSISAKISYNKGYYD